MTRGGCFDIDTERSEVFAQASGSTVMTSADEVIASSDMVYICTWTSEHQSLVEKCIAAGKPFFCEKPLSIGLREANEMYVAATASGLTHQCGLILRRSPAYLWAR